MWFFITKLVANCKDVYLIKMVNFQAVIIFIRILSEEFSRSIYWNKYKLTDNKKVDITADNEEKHIRELLDSSYEGVKRLFVLAYDNTEGDNQVSLDFFFKYFLPRVKIENYNIEIDGSNFYDQAINDSIKQYDEVRKVSTGQGDDFTLLAGFCLFWKKLQINCCWFKQTKNLKPWIKSNSTVFFTGKISAAANTKVIIYHILEQSKEAVLQFSKGTTKVL